MVITKTIHIETDPTKTPQRVCIIDITPQVEQQVAETAINDGTVTLFVAGSTAGQPRRHRHRECPSLPSSPATGRRADHLERDRPGHHFYLGSARDADYHYRSHHPAARR